MPTLWMVAVLAGVMSFAGCKKEGTSTGNQAESETPTKSGAHHPTDPIASSTGHPGMAHDPAHPPIDCPLRKQGVDPAHMRPFEDVERYITFLEREDRSAWQKPDDVVAALGLAGSETVIDLGQARAISHSVLPKRYREARLSPPTSSPR